MKKLILILLLISSNAYALDFNWTDDYLNYRRKIETHLEKHFVTTNPKKYQGKLYHKALTLVPLVLQICSDEDINPSLVAALITLESNWQIKAVEKNSSAMGLLQVKFYEVDLNDPRDQLETGVRMLKNAYNKCGTIEGAIAYYATGQKCNGYKRGKLRINLAKKIERY